MEINIKIHKIMPYIVVLSLLLGITGCGTKEPSLSEEYYAQVADEMTVSVLNNLDSHVVSCGIGETVDRIITDDAKEISEVLISEIPENIKLNSAKKKELEDVITFVLTSDEVKSMHVELRADINEATKASIAEEVSKTATETLKEFDVTADIDKNGNATVSLDYEKRLDKLEELLYEKISGIERSISESSIRYSVNEQDLNTLIDEIHKKLEVSTVLTDDEREIFASILEIKYLGT